MTTKQPHSVTAAPARSTSRRGNGKIDRLMLGYWAVLVLMILISLVSGYTTFTGMEAVFADLWIAILLTVGVQSLILVVLGVLMTPGISWWLRRFIEITYALAVLVSVTFGAARYVEGFSQDHYVKQTYKDEVRAISDRVARATGDHGRAQRLAATVAAFSRQRRDEEVNKGGTCGDGSGPDYGPRARLRDDDAATTEAFAEQFAESQSTLDQLTARAEQLVKAFNFKDSQSFEASVDEAYALYAGASRELERGNLIVEFQEWTRQRLLKGDEGFADARGRRVTCKDARLRAFLTQVLQLKTVHLQASDNPEFIWPGRRTAVASAFEYLMVSPFQRLLGMGEQVITLAAHPQTLGFGLPVVHASTVAAGSADADRSPPTVPLEAFPLFIALWVDGSLLLLAVCGHQLLLASRRGNVALIEARVQEDLRRDGLLAMLRDFVVRDGDHEFLIVPIGGDFQVTDVARTIVRRLEPLNVLGDPVRVSMDQIKQCAWWKRTQVGIFTGAKGAEIWPIDKDFMKRIHDPL